MHESALARAMIERAIEEADRLGAGGVRAIHVRVGELSGTDPEFVEHALEEMAEGTPAGGARIVIEQVAGSILCRTCSREGGVEQGLAVCPVCGSVDVQVLAGLELGLSGIEIDEPPPAREPESPP